MVSPIQILLIDKIFQKPPTLNLPSCRIKVTTTDFVSPPFVSLLSEVKKIFRNLELIFFTRNLFSSYSYNFRLAALWVSGWDSELHRSPMTKMFAWVDYNLLQICVQKMLFNNIFSVSGNSGSVWLVPTKYPYWITSW